MKVLILQGLPGSGKTTWAKEFVHKNKDWVRVNRDDLRNMRGDYWIPKQEELITRWEREGIISALFEGYNVIIDSTNLNDKYRHLLKYIIESYYGKVTFENKFFDTPLDKCIKNDLKRPNSVGEKVIRDMYKRYLEPKVEQYAPDESKPKAIIVDVDGTLAHMDGRSPYDWGRVYEDDIDKYVKILISSLSNFEEVESTSLGDHTVDSSFEVIVLSGRDSVCRGLTETWLQDHRIHYSKLFMRPEGNTEDDALLKKRIFFEDIAPHYNVQFVFDDRNKVVDMWRSIGLKCFQCQPGDF